ncbi:transposase [Trichonephila clavipes]|nr:transposase [Trichonephila clavipes]
MKHGSITTRQNKTKLSAEWTATGESCPKRPKIQMSSGRVMVSVFWDLHGILFIDYLEKDKKINSECCMVLLEQPNEQTNKKKTSSNAKEVKVLFRQDKAPCHKSMEKMVRLNELRIERERENYFPTHRTVQRLLTVCKP